MASIWTLFYCKDKQNKQVDKPAIFKLQSKQDTANKKATQSIFDEIAEFDYSDFHDLKHNKSYDMFLAGQIKLPTGQVVCTDLMHRELAWPQSWAINNGQYPVYLYIGLEDDFAGRVAYAELVIKAEIPKYWEMSLIPEELLADSFERKTNGMYPVENGLSCFADFETFKIYEQEIQDFYQLHKQGNYYNDVLENLFKENRNIPTSSRGEDWINYKPLKANGNIIMFGSGYGDGLYPRYVGYDKNGNVVKFVTDFIQLKARTEH
ncbi:DUF4241 domain-containing protein [Hymenobacter terricola]|uniref:DUF4241 domain-containing protein n=1 Tax=Hymenobacter terricola TaxID=2819236 RepID=UPI001B31339C|nr:DUF4241 domain-containing protein [Hymenobacter terricola]